jgi:hypothetical protein
MWNWIMLYGPWIGGVGILLVLLREVTEERHDEDSSRRSMRRETLDKVNRHYGDKQ